MLPHEDNDSVQHLRSDDTGDRPRHHLLGAMLVGLIVLLAYLGMHSE